MLHARDPPPTLEVREFYLTVCQILPRYLFRTLIVPCRTGAASSSANGLGRRRLLTAQEQYTERVLYESS